MRDHPPYPSPGPRRMRDHPPYPPPGPRWMRHHPPCRSSPMRPAIISVFFSAALLWPVCPSVGQQEKPSMTNVHFVDVAATAGFRDRVINGGEKTKKYVFESTG